MAEYKVECGRTTNRGNWVSVSKDGYSVRLSDDHERGTSQRRLRNNASEILDKWLQSEVEE